MQLFDNIRLAFGSLWANKLRALLTMLGIIIGIGSVIAIVTLGDSLTGSITDSLQSFGINNITVSLQQKSEDDETSGGAVRMFGLANPSSEDLFTDAMIEEFRSAYPEQIYAIALDQSLGSGQVQQGDTTVQVTAMGVNEEYALANDLNLLHGRFIKDSDGERQIAVVSDVFCESVFGQSGASVLGQEFELTVNGQLLKFYVAGVYEYDDDGFVSMTGSDPVTELYLPLETAQKLNGGETGYQSFTVVASTGTDTTAFLEQVESFFASFYTRNESYTATASSMESMLEEMTSMLNTVKLAISAIAAISLLVGGIGVMNIMLVSITERTREIGTRKALGAPGFAIRMQFITEAVVICLVGGALGVALGVGLGAAGAGLLGYAAKPSLSAIGLAVGFSMLIGVFFGYYPAGKAAKMDPIEALRYE
ncbi:ABC transporter permease [Allofournierella massiliensis]|uniref:ABC transporter permease n=1 Tax=Allofournierella massiliensis TaxID=1650663 RepID=A0ABT7USV7_9FIRM|nr:ABC transporter permease [Fournierella massiliensis]MDM8201975.1 ABC transporter permease [Fournierella massiliensis]